MLQFFRRYQKFFFVFVTTFVVISFCFFGTFSSMLQGAKDQDREVGHTVDGSSIMARELDAITRMLSPGYEEHATSPNLFNDGVLRKELFSTGLASLIADRYFEEMREDLEVRLKKGKYYQPYVHPRAPFISAELAWQQYFPSMSKDLALAKSWSGTGTVEDFNLLVRLYLSQLQISPDTLKQLLAYQQSHFTDLQPDPRLPVTDFSLFGFHTLEDWFGPHFLQRVGKCILNGAVLAQEKGYSVTYNEARAELFSNVQTALQHYQINTLEAPSYFHQQLQALQLDEVTAVKAWRKVMLFRRVLHDAKGSAIVDPFMYENFATFASEGVSVEVYQLPEELRFKNFNGIFKLQVYLEAVAPKLSQDEVLPTQFFSVAQVEQKVPELVHQQFTVEIAGIDAEALAAQVGLKETWNWELEENNWPLLCAEFPFLKECSATGQEERFEFLEGLTSQERFKVDHYARVQIVGQHPEWIDAALEKAPVESQPLSIRAKGGKLPLVGVIDRSGFAQLLLEAAADQNSQAAEQLSRFSADKRNFYKIRVVNADPKKEILPFAVATRDGTLQALLDARLERAHPELRRKEPSVFGKTDGTLKPLHEVREEIGRRIFSSLAQKLGVHPEQRLAVWMERIKEGLERDPENLLWIQKEEEEGQAELAAQWRLKKSSKIITRGSGETVSAADIFTLPSGAWTPLHIPETGDLTFARVMGGAAGEPRAYAVEGQEILSIGARRLLMGQILDAMERKGV